MPIATCPNREELSGLLLGKLPADSAAELETHVDSCPQCQTAIISLNDSGDWIAASLKQFAGSLPAMDDQCREMLNRIRQLEPSVLSAHDAVVPQIEPEQDFGSIGFYKLLAKLGEGGMGAVYKAQHTRLRRTVAVKVLPADRVQSPEAIARFDREMQAVGALDHVNIVRAFDAGDHDGRHYIAMEYVKGRDLSQIAKAAGPLPIADACEIIRQAAVGLQHAHEAGLVHRDIKPGNLMLTELGVVKVLDLGLARLGQASGVGELTTTGQVMGTLDYMAPEQGGDTHHVDIRADIYSLGASLYRLLTGEAPFGDAKYDTPVKKLMALAITDPVPVQSRRPDISPELAAIIHNMLAKTPEQRFSTPAAVEAALAPFCVGADLKALAAMNAPFSLAPVLRGEGRGEGPAETIDTAPHLSSAMTGTLALGNPAVDRSALTQAASQKFSAIPPIWRRPWAIAAACGGAAILLLAIWIVVKDRYGNVVSKTRVPDDGSIGLERDDEQTREDWALSFAGTEDHVELPGLEFDGKSPITLEAWLDNDLSLTQQTPDPVVCGLIGENRYIWMQLMPDRKIQAVVSFDLAGLHSPEGSCRLVHPVDLPRQRCHVALCWDDSDDLRLFINGKNAGLAQKTPFTGVRPKSSHIGNSRGSARFHGTLDEVRVSRLARYTGDFTPESRFKPDADTLALYHCDEGVGDKLLDSSSNNHHGKIVGAKWVKANSSSAAPPSTPPQFALDFNHPAETGNARVELPALLHPFEPCTVEMYVTARSASDTWENRCLFIVGGGVQLRQQKSNWDWYTPGKNDTYDRVIVAGGVMVGRRMHLAGVSTGKELRMYVDGQLAGKTSITGELSVAAAPCLLGGLAASFDAWKPFDGFIDEVKISKTARYNENFTPAVRFESDADTLALYHFDEGAGEQLVDSSGNGHHGKIVGAKWVKAGAVAASVKPRGGSSVWPSEPRHFKPNEPLSPMSLVKQPATIEGVMSWTLETRGHRGTIRGVGFNYDNSLFATAGTDGSVRIWDAATYELKKLLKPGRGPIWSIAWSPRENYLAVGAANTGFSVWNVDSGKHAWVQQGGDYNNILPIVWSPDGAYLLVKRHHTNTAHVLDASTGQELRQLKVAGHVESLAWSPNGKWIAVCGHFPAIAVVETSGWTRKHDFKIEKTGTWGRVAFSPESDMLLAFGPGTQALWSLTNGERVHPEWLSHISIGSDNSSVAWWNHAFMFFDGSLKIYDTAENRFLHKVADAASYGEAACWSSDGKRAIVGLDDGSWLVWDLQKRDVVHRRTMTTKPFNQGVLGNFFPVPDHLFVRACASDDEFGTLPLDSPVIEQVFTGRIGWSTDRTRMIQADDQEALVWNATNGKILQRLQREKPVALACLSPDGKLAATADDDGVVVTWNAETGEDVVSPATTAGVKRFLSWLPDGSSLAVGGPGGMELLDPSSGKRLDLFDFKLAASPDDKPWRSHVWLPSARRASFEVALFRVGIRLRSYILAVRRRRACV